MERMYNLKLGESMNFEDKEIIRVPGGWIITMIHHSWSTVNDIFVPYNNDLLF